MKRLLVCLSAVALFASCKEKDILINGSGSVISTNDTTYVGSVETAQPKKILIEEFTGAACIGCPAARDLLKAIDNKYPDRLVKIELHPYGNPNGGPVSHLGKYDFRTQSVTDILNTYFGGALVGIPVAGIDRLPYSGSRSIDKEYWSGYIDERIKVASVANMMLTNSYDAGKGEGNVKVKIAYTKEARTKQFISVAIIENNIVDAQKYPSYIDTFYNFKHILRKLVTPASGMEILATIPTKEAGRVFIGNIKYNIDAAWKAENCQLVVFLHNNFGEDKEVLQVDEVDVKTP
ncbi:hypothetical protein CAP35_14045 [Chitinophagaceae bacterium IBVUCB1]|nr:hypothetical protein CAP35_14045 [Chitinophagaceae bacterium IBVUCB1]